MITDPTPWVSVLRGQAQRVLSSSQLPTYGDNATGLIRLAPATTHDCRTAAPLTISPGRSSQPKRWRQIGPPRWGQIRLTHLPTTTAADGQAVSGSPCLDVLRRARTERITEIGRSRAISAIHLAPVWHRGCSPMLAILVCLRYRPVRVQVGAGRSSPGMDFCLTGPNRAAPRSRRHAALTTVLRMRSRG
jgi:hypothetical protein